MKKILTLATSLALAAGASAQSYDKMWKAVKQQAEQDLPQSALKGVEEIRDKAAMEHNRVRVLRAILMLRVYSAEVSSLCIANRGGFSYRTRCCTESTLPFRLSTML